MHDSQQTKITEHHRSRKAMVYLRQSSPKQVEENLESQLLQYAMADRARALGFTQVETIDCDLGKSASLGAADRRGFDDIISSVAKGEVGMVLSREVSRLSRTNKDWCQLFEVCQIFDTLIGDEQQVYDLSSLDDQLVLGIKGTMSVVELNVMKMRMLRGQEEKARRGELFKRLPSGYVRDGDCHVVRTPDQRVREAIALVFRKFRAGPARGAGSGAESRLQRSLPERALRPVEGAVHRDRQHARSDPARIARPHGGDPSVRLHAGREGRDRGELPGAAPDRRARPRSK